MPADEAIARVLAGRAPCDALDGRGQAAVRASWDEQIAARIDGLDLTDRLQAASRPWPEADAKGATVMRDGLV